MPPIANLIFYCARWGFKLDFRLQKIGIQWQLTEHLEDLDYVDDLTLWSHNSKINISKTKDLRVNSNTTEAFKIREEAIETVDDFTYLGSADGRGLLDINQKKSKARSAFAKLKSIGRSNNISLHLKMKLFNACVKSVLLYGCETWYVTYNIMQKLQALVNRFPRNILAIWWTKKLDKQI